MRKTGVKRSLISSMKGKHILTHISPETIFEDGVDYQKR